MSPREIYDILVARYGQTGIDDILYPVWDKSIGEGPILENEQPEFTYHDFIDNMDWFLDVLRERGKWPPTDASS